MSCDQCQEVMSEYIDGDLERGEEAQVEKHLSRCETCQAVRDDLVQIVHFSRNLPDHAPGVGLWSRIQAEIQAERRTGTSSFKAGVLWNNLRTGSFTFSFPQLAVAASALILVMVSLSVLRWGAGNAETVQSLQPDSQSEQSVQSAVVEPANMQDILQKLGELKSNVELRKAGWNPEVRDIFDRDILYIDQTLVECNHAIQDNPKDDICREMMLNACREKMRLLEGFADY